MPLFKKLTDEEQLAKWDKEDKQMLRKNYDLLHNQKEYPKWAHLLKPDKLQAISYEHKDDNIHVNIGYKNSFSSYITESTRVNYDRIYKGTLICSEVKTITKLSFTPKSNIKHSFLSSYKELTIPILNELTLYVKCKKIFIGNFGIYAIHNNKLILEDEYREILRKQIENSNR